MHVAIQSTIGAWHHLMRGHRIAAAVDHEDRFGAVFGRSPSIFLVRPDGYLAFSGTDKSITDLASHCDRWLVSTAAEPKVEPSHA